MIWWHSKQLLQRLPKRKDRLHPLECYTASTRRCRSLKFAVLTWPVVWLVGMFMFVYDCLCVQMWMLFSSWLFDNLYAFRTIHNHLRKTSWFIVQEDRRIDEVRVNHVGKAYCWTATARCGDLAWPATTFDSLRRARLLRAVDIQGAWFKLQHLLEYRLQQE
jgi:hypothetical protein